MYTKYGTVIMILFCKYKMTISRYNALYEIAIVTFTWGLDY